jgi:hypothetical protein
MAWDRLREDFVREPIRLEAADETLDRLNRNSFPVDAVAPANVYAVAGRYEDGIVGKVRKEMARRFPDARLPRLEEPREGVLAFAYLQSNIRFPVPYLNHPDGITFRDSPGHSRNVAGFGFRALRHPFWAREQSEQFEQQVQILNVELDSKEKPRAFAIDPWRKSSPDQLVIARMERKATLAATLADLEKAIAKFARSGSENGSFIHGDQVWIPQLSLDLEYRFRDLEGSGRRFLNETMQGLYVGTAVQTVRFKLDGNGAEVAASGRFGGVKSRPTQNLTFDRPFLVYAKKRDAKYPFLVMWIDNSGMMQFKEPPPPLDD